jgi:hypothetical protein
MLTAECDTKVAESVWSKEAREELLAAMPISYVSNVSVFRLLSNKLWL